MNRASVGTIRRLITCQSFAHKNAVKAKYMWQVVLREKRKFNFLPQKLNYIT